MIRQHHEQVHNITKPNGDTIHGVYNYTDKSNPLIVLSPPFEKDIRSMMVLMAYLINNGFNVFRYDNTYHPGNSTGDITYWTLSKALDDMETVIGFVRSGSEVDSSGGLSLVGTSISSRVAFRYLATNRGAVDSFLAIVGVVNMQHTLRAVLNFDLVEEFLTHSGKDWGVKKVVHYPVDLTNFIRDCVGHRFHNLQSTIEDISEIRSPMAMIVSEDDQWVDIHEYHAAFENAATALSHVLEIPGAGHKLYKNPESARIAFLGTIRVFSEVYFNRALTQDEILIPKVPEIIALNKNERARERGSVSSAFI